MAIPIVTVVSGTKGGTGKTTIAVNLAVLASYRLRASSEYPVVLIDLGVDNGTASKILLGGVFNVQYTIVDYLTGVISNPLYAFYVKSWRVDNDEFRVVFSIPGSMRDRAIIGFRIRGIIDAVANALSPRLVIVDTPSIGFDRSILASVLSASTHIIPVATVDHSSVESLRGIVEFAKLVNPGLKVLKPILNMYNPKYPKDPTTGREWLAIVKEAVGIEPFTVSYDELFYIVRQAMEVESIKLSVSESPALMDINRYFNEVLLNSLNLT